MVNERICRDAKVVVFFGRLRKRNCCLSARLNNAKKENNEQRANAFMNFLQVKFHIFRFLFKNFFEDKSELQLNLNWDFLLTECFFSPFFPHHSILFRLISSSCCCFIKSLLIGSVNGTDADEEEREKNDFIFSLIKFPLKSETPAKQVRAKRRKNANFCARLRWHRTLFPTSLSCLQ